MKWRKQYVQNQKDADPLAENDLTFTYSTTSASTSSPILPESTETVPAYEGTAGADGDETHPHPHPSTAGEEHPPPPQQSAEGGYDYSPAGSYYYPPASDDYHDHYHYSDDEVNNYGYYESGAYSDYFGADSSDYYFSDYYTDSYDGGDYYYSYDWSGHYYAPYDDSYQYGYDYYGYFDSSAADYDFYYGSDDYYGSDNYYGSDFYYDSSEYYGYDYDDSFYGGSYDYSADTGSYYDSYDWDTYNYEDDEDINGTYSQSPSARLSLLEPISSAGHSNHFKLSPLALVFVAIVSGIVSVAIFEFFRRLCKLPIERKFHLCSRFCSHQWRRLYKFGVRYEKAARHADLSIDEKIDEEVDAYYKDEDKISEGLTISDSETTQANDIENGDSNDSSEDKEPEIKDESSQHCHEQIILLNSSHGIAAI